VLDSFRLGLLAYLLGGVADVVFRSSISPR